MKRSGNKKCARDHNWGHAQRAIGRQDCQCSRQVGVFVAIYRLWKCTNDGIVENLGLGAVSDRNPNLVENDMRKWTELLVPRRSNRTKRQCVFYEQEADRNQDLKAKEGHDVVRRRVTLGV